MTRKNGEKQGKGQKNISIQELIPGSIQPYSSRNRLAPNYALIIPKTSAIAPATGLCVASMIAGKVMTDNVIYGT